MKNLISLSLLTVTLFTGSGCSKFRALTRRDYAFLSDPFARRSDGEEETPPGEAEPSTSGFVKIDNTEPEPVRANYAAVSQSKPAEVASSTGFQGIRVRGMGDAISTEIGSRTANEEADAASRNKALLASSEFEGEKTQQTANASLNPEVAETLLPQLPAMTAAKPDSSETDSELLAEFADFAASKKAKWTAEVKEVEEKAAPLIRQPIRQVSDTVSEIDKVMETNSEAKNEKATPLLLQQAVRQVERQESPLARPIMPERPADKPILAEGEPMFEEPEDPVNPKDHWQRAAPSIGLHYVAPENSEPPVFDPPKPRPLIDGAKPVRENPFALIAQEAEVTQDAAQPTIQPAPSFDDFAASAEEKRVAAPADAPDEEPTWFAGPKESSPKKTIDAGFNFDDAWKPVDADGP